MNKSWLIKPFLNDEYPQAAYGKGIYLYDTEGNEYLDGSSGAVTAGIGHGVLEIADVMKEQAEKVSFVYRSQFTNEPAEKLAAKLKEWAPGDVNWSFFVNSGSEAAETALKVAIQYWQEKGKKTKTKVLSRWMSYHGITLGALSMSGHLGRRERFSTLLEDFPVLEPPYCYRCPFNRTFPECSLHCASELETAIRRVGAENIAAFIAEPVIGAAGAAIVPPDGYYQAVMDICRRNDILFIADEVMSGIGRCGSRFAIEHWGVTPDIIVLGKGLGAGYAPIAAAMISDRVMEPIFKGSGLIMSGHTYSANPQSAAVALEVLEYMEVHKLVEKAKENGVYMKERLRELQQKYPIIGDVRGRGMLTGVEFVSNIFNKLPFSREVHVSRTIIDRAMKNGLIVYPASAGADGLNGDAVIIAPPLVIKKEEIDKLAAIFEATVKEVQDELQLLGFFSSVG
ncbi:aspartate aminotransferase family protein [Alteribacter natronophilus]|uniref:aspartate aminotransferase family protein n=1 Tax=Alteribacter natronophilus TaxID=2583810 RepID=UPI00110EC0A0|nr:aspartate aminotransferase family protein [Alteribacter natronophilus]TMW73517.1 aspartate aminotransferase family protein [Alteribacter natronophilus]